MTPRPAPTGLLGKLFATLLTAALLVLGFMFSVVVLAVVAVLGVLGFGYFWWKTRALRRAIREQQMNPRQYTPDNVIEGEATVVREGPIVERNTLIEGHRTH